VDYSAWRIKGAWAGEPSTSFSGIGQKGMGVGIRLLQSRLALPKRGKRRTPAGSSEKSIPKSTRATEATGRVGIAEL